MNPAYLFFAVVAVVLAWVAGIVVMSVTGHSGDIGTLNGAMTGVLGALIAAMQWLNHNQTERATSKANEAVNAAVVGVQQNQEIIQRIEKTK